jgi:hypothetical protein
VLHPETKAEAFKGNRHTGSLASAETAFASATADEIAGDQLRICEFRSNPATDSDFIPATIPI